MATSQGGAHPCIGIRFVASTRRYLFIRPEDGVLIPRPHQGKAHHLDELHRMNDRHLHPLAGAV